MGTIKLLFFNLIVLVSSTFVYAKDSYRNSCLNLIERSNDQYYFNGKVKLGFNFISSIGSGPAIYVDINNPSATDVRSGLSNYSEATPFKTITAALSAALSNDEIWVRSGTYNESIDLSSSNKNLSIIYDHVYHSAGSAPALKLTSLNYSSITITLINSTISNTGDPSNRVGSAAVLITQAGNSVSVTGIGNSTISSQEGSAVTFATNDASNSISLNQLKLSSVNANVISLGSQNILASLVDCTVTSSNSTAFTWGSYLYLNNCIVNTYGTAISGISYSGLTIIGSTINSSHGNGINASVYGIVAPMSSYARIDNSTFNCYNEGILINTGNVGISNYGKVRNCVFEIFSPTTTYALTWDNDAGSGLIGSGNESIWECTNNRSNKPFAAAKATRINLRNQLFTLIDHSVLTNETNLEVNNRGTTTVGSPLVLNNTLTLQNKDNDPSATSGTIYFNKTANTFKGFSNNTWKTFMMQEDANALLSKTWIYGGNVVSTPGDNILGTLNAQELILKANGYEGLRIKTDGSIVIGMNNTTSSVNTNGYRFAVNGDALFTKIKLKSFDQWPDYVFSNQYHLRSLEEIEQFIKTHKHLPEVPSENEIIENGLDVEGTQELLLKKIEELTLYLIEANKEIQLLKEKMKALENK